MRGVLAIGLAWFWLMVGAPMNPYRIAVVPMTNSHTFFLTIKAGAEKAGKELGAQILWRGPNDETDVAGQIAIVENFIAQKVDAIVLAPCAGGGVCRSPPAQSVARCQSPSVRSRSAR